MSIVVLSSHVTGHTKCHLTDHTHGHTVSFERVSSILFHVEAESGLAYAENMLNIIPLIQKQVQL
jgi:hypothetical protein